MKAAPASKLSANALKVLEARYLLRDERRRIAETPDGLFRRVAHHISQAELSFGGEGEASRWEEAFYRLISSLDFLPNSPTLMNAGTPFGQLSACFVLPVGDSMEEIFEALKKMALVQRTGGGTGFSFSRLRPRDDLVHSTGGDASGPVSFMKVFDSATENIKQGGRRRGANMGVLRVDHPDVLEFVAAKREAALQNFNLSIGVTDAFMTAAEGDGKYETVHPRTGKAMGKLRAAEVFSKIASAAWASGDPGLLFLDAINRANPTPAIGPIEATNPCGEVPLLPYESCNLGSVNLPRHLRGRPGREEIDWDRLGETASVAVRFLDDVIEVNRYPFPEITAAAKGNRKIGLGVMGFADLLIRLGIPYESKEAVETAERLMRHIAETARGASRDLASERGVFPNWNESVFAGKSLPLRNATQTSIAPTGTISIIAGASASIEPLFALAYRRRGVLDGETLWELNRTVIDYADRHGLDAKAWEREIRSTGTLQGADLVPGHARCLFATALTIPPEHHLAIQEAFQRNVDNAVSKTINLPEESTPSDIASAYREAWRRELKGVTVYRYGSKGAQVLELGAGDDPAHVEHGSRCDPGECSVRKEGGAL